MINLGNYAPFVLCPPPGLALVQQFPLRLYLESVRGLASDDTDNSHPAKGPGPEETVEFKIVDRGGSFVIGMLFVPALLLELPSQSVEVEDDAVDVRQRQFAQDGIVRYGIDRLFGVLETALGSTELHALIGS